MSTTLPFPSSGSVKSNLSGQQDSEAMKIDIPKSKEEAAAHHSSSQHRKGGQQNLAASAPSENANSTINVPPRGSSNQAPSHWHHHPRPPLPTSDSYFPNSGNSSTASSLSGTNSSTTTQQPRTPGSMRNHSRQASGGSIAVSGGSAIPTSSVERGSRGKAGGHNMSLSLSNGAQNGAASSNQAAESFADFGTFGQGPPSPSTLTDIILGLHSTLYGGKRTAEEVREMVNRFYDQDAIFESPLLAASGREQIANQFIMAFTLPGLDVKSELRDVICSDFEFDGTRAGIIDQTISVTLLPSLFGRSNDEASTSAPRSATYAPNDYQHDRGGSATPAYTLHSGITPHPFANYSQIHTPAGGGSMFSRFASQSHSPTTPYSVSSLWGNSRPHTPGTTSSHIRPLSQNIRPSTPPSVNGDDDDFDHTNSNTTIQGYGDESHYMSANEAGGGQVTRPPMPADALQPHWSHQGLGRTTVRAFLWGVFHPRAVLKHICTINLRLMSRLEFNDAGLIVRHEDTWGVRETIEGVVPFASLLYALERRIVGYICSFAIGRGFRLSNALARHAIGPAAEKQPSRWQIEHQDNANEAAHALLLGYHRHEKMQSMARSRASSPTRQRFSTMHGAGHTPHTIGSSHGRSRARSLIGGPQSAAPTRAASSDNLLSIGQYGQGYGERERGNTHGGETLPPDSSARYRTGSRRITTSTASAPVTGMGIMNPSATGTLDGPWQQADIYGASIDTPSESTVKSRAPDRDTY